MYRARFSAWVPMSPMQPGGPAPLRVGAPRGLLRPRALEGVREPALRVLDDRLAVLVPSVPFLTSSRACLTIALPV